MYHFKTLASITATPRKNNRKSISSLKASIDSKSSEIYQNSILSPSII